MRCFGVWPTAALRRSRTSMGRVWTHRSGCGPRGGTRRARSRWPISTRRRSIVTLKPGAGAPGGVRLPTGSLRFPAGTRVAELPGFDRGDFWVQDAAAALPAKLLAPLAGERVVDLCAAPGGKTAQLAAAGASVVAVERDPARSGAPPGQPAALASAGRTCAGGRRRMGSRPGQFDAVLLDAPCSATGTIRRHPDVPHLKRPRDVRALAETQDRLLQAAATLLREGGRLIYSVCSLQPEEGVPRVEAAVARGDLRRDPFAPAELAALPEALTPDGYPAHPTQHVARAWRHGRLLCRAPDQDLTAALVFHQPACLHRGHACIATCPSHRRAKHSRC